jgi:hypothetical protein
VAGRGLEDPKRAQRWKPEGHAPDPIQFGSIL